MTILSFPLSARAILSRDAHENEGWRQNAIV